jgi:hypothetical protein
MKSFTITIAWDEGSPSWQIKRCITYTGLNRIETEVIIARTESFIEGLKWTVEKYISLVDKIEKIDDSTSSAE